MMKEEIYSTLTPHDDILLLKQFLFKSHSLIELRGETDRTKQSLLHEKKKDKWKKKLKS